MSAIFSYKQWMEIVDRGTSGDQVYDILASWKADASALRSRVEELENELAEAGKNQSEYHNTVLAQEKEIARLREMVDASNSALGRIYEIAYDWKPEPVPYCDDGDNMTMQPWDKSEPIPPEVNNE